MNINIPKEVQTILNKFNEAGYQIYIVGGAVRDLIMGNKVHDWDFTTDAKPEEILKLFPNGFYDNKFGTVGIASSSLDNSKTRGEQTSNEIYEITTMRREDNYQDSRHPTEISWTNKLEEDLARRDFTINAMALRQVSGQANDIVDPYNGQQDIQEKIIRAVGDPNTRFQEDALRLMRAIRIATQLDFQIDPATFQAIQDNAALIKNIAQERIRDELFKLLATKNPLVGIELLKKTGILEIILPELTRCFGIVQEGPKHDRVYDIGEHSLLSLKHCPSKDPLVRLAALLHDVGKFDTMNTEEDGNVTFYNHDIVGGRTVKDIARRFNLSNKQSDKLYNLVRFHMFTLNETQTDSAIRRFIKNVGLDNIDDMMAVRIGDRLGGGTQNAVSWRMEKYQERIKQVLQKPFSITDLKVNGKDVMEILHIEPGKKVGEILQKLFEEVLEDASKNNREYLLEKVESMP